MIHQKVLIIDFGSQYTQLIARRVRELNIYCEIYPFNGVPDIDDSVKAIILSGSPFSVRDKNSPYLDLKNIRKTIPLLGICYGAQFIAQINEGDVVASKIREYGRANLHLLQFTNKLFKDVPNNSQVWMSHGDTISLVSESFEVIASTNDVDIAAYQIKNEDTYGIQFHPEVYHTTYGLKILSNFLIDICGFKQDWTPDSFVNETVDRLRKKIGNDKVILGISGGVDSTVAAVLLNKAISKNLYCIFVDNGLLRKNEYNDVLAQYHDMGLNVKGVNAKELIND